MRLWHISLGGSVLTALLLAALFPPFGFTLLAPVALTPILYAAAWEPDGRRRFLWGWLSGLIYWAVVCSWIRDVLAAYGGLTGPLSWLALFLFAVAKGLHTAVFSWLAGYLVRRRWAIPAVAALWVGLERTHGPLGFPWLTLGNAGVDMSLPLRAAPVAGVYGVSFVFAALACGLTLVAMRRDRRELLWLLALPLLWLLPGVHLREAPGEQAVAMQTNVGADTAWSMAEKDRMLKEFAVRTLQEGLDPDKPKPALLLWPEAPAPFYYYEDAALRLQVGEAARLTGAPLMMTGVAFTPEKDPLNSAFLIDETGRLAGRYDKVKLVPFGEYIPAGFGWIQKISSEAGNYAPGAGIKVFPVGRHSAGSFICYESAFPDYVRTAAANGAEVLVNLTNDGYFGGGFAREQHLLLARMRAIENRRWLLRPANDGITASIDPSGRVWDRMPAFQRMTGRLRFGWIREKTLYTQYGDWFAWLCLIGGLGAGLVLVKVDE